MNAQNNSVNNSDPLKVYISEIEFNNGRRLTVDQNSIILFVGPNNVGKSQSLNDIYVKGDGTNASIVVSNIYVKKIKGSLIPLVEKICKASDNGSYYSFMLNGMGHKLNKDNGSEEFLNKNGYAGYRDLFVKKLSTEARLSICNPVSIVNRDQIWSHPIHYAAFDTECSKWLSENFYKAFGNNLTANSVHGSTIPLCIGPTVTISNQADSAIESINTYAEILESYKTVNTQGDGIKSFVGILLYLMQAYYCTYLIDEPESFLHPPQARIMGQIIGETLRDDQQAFISTHSEDVLKGLLDACENRLKIVRVTREDDINSFSILDNDKIKSVFGNPLLKYSNIMSSLFHKTVVLCESDSDCKFYSVIDNHIKHKNGKYSETLFIHCGGKQRMARTADALISLNIDVRLIPDIDLLNDEQIIKDITKVFGINWQSLKADYNRFVSGLHSSKEKINRIHAKKSINILLDNSDADDLSKNEIKQIYEIVRTDSKWDNIKHGGKQVIPNGEATIGYSRIEKEFRKHNIYLVPVGELEGFVKEVGGHGPEWVNNVLERYPNMSDDVYKDAREFVEGIGL